MQARAESRQPRWLFVVIAIVGSLAILAAAFKYLDGGSNRSAKASGNPSGDPGRSLSKATIQGTARSVQIAGAVGLISLSIDMGADHWTVRSSGAPIEGTGQVTAQGDGIIASVFRAVIGPNGATFESRDGHVKLPDGTLVNGTPVHGNNIDLAIDTAPRPWLDPPPSMEFRAVDQFSWAGSGDIAVAGRQFSGEFLGAMGSLTVMLTRTADAVLLQGSGGTQQVFVEGKPALTTTATIDRLRTDITVKAGDPNDRTYVTWAPRDTGPFGICILRVTARLGHSEWVSVGLQHMPPMFGGEQHEPIGGDTSGLGDQGRFFGGPDAIDSFIGVGAADRRDLSISVPAGTPPGVYPIEIALEGNFDPVTFSMSVTVAG
jgi:hypothetical protein